MQSAKCGVLSFLAFFRQLRMPKCFRLYWILHASSIFLPVFMTMVIPQTAYGRDACKCDPSVSRKKYAWVNEQGNEGTALVVWLGKSSIQVISFLRTLATSLVTPFLNKLQINAGVHLPHRIYGNPSHDPFFCKTRFPNIFENTKTTSLIHSKSRRWLRKVDEKALQYGPMISQKKKKCLKVYEKLEQRRFLNNSYDSCWILHDFTRIYWIWKPKKYKSALCLFRPF